MAERLPNHGARQSNTPPTGADLKPFLDWLRRKLPGLDTQITQLQAFTVLLQSQIATIAADIDELAPKKLTIVTVPANTVTLGAAHVGVYVRFTNGAGCTVTVDAGVFTTGEISHLRGVNGQLQLVQGSGVTINTGETLNSRQAESPLMLVCLDAGGTEFDLFGDMELV